MLPFQLQRSLVATTLHSTRICIEIQPKYPAPGEEVTLSINDYRGSSYGANITWVLDGRVIPEAENKREAKVTTGALGTNTISWSNFNLLWRWRESLQTVIRPIYLDIIIGHKHTFQKTILDEHHRALAAPSMLLYLRRGAGFQPRPYLHMAIGQQVIEGVTPWPQSSFIYHHKQQQRNTPVSKLLRLTAVSFASRSISIPSVAPEIHFLWGKCSLVWVKKTFSEGISLIGNSLVVAAEPYYLDSRVYK